MPIPVSSAFLEDNLPHELPVGLSAEQMAWVQRRAEALQVAPDQFIRYVLNRWMRAERQHQRTERRCPAASKGDAPPRETPSAPAAADSPAEPEASSASERSPTVIESLRQGLRAMKALENGPPVRRRPLPAPNGQRAKSTSDADSDASRDDASPDDASGPPSLFDVAWDAPDAS